MNLISFLFLKGERRKMKELTARMAVCHPLRVVDLGLAVHFIELLCEKNSLCFHVAKINFSGILYVLGKQIVCADSKVILNDSDVFAHLNDSETQFQYSCSDYTLSVFYDEDEDGQFLTFTFIFTKNIAGVDSALLDDWLSSWRRKCEHEGNATTEWVGKDDLGGCRSWRGANNKLVFSITES